MAGPIDNHAGQDKDRLIGDIRQQFLNVANRRTVQADLEKQSILQNCADPVMAGIISDLTVISFHILDAVGRYGPINNTNISLKTGIPKGTVSKNITKLLYNGLIMKESIPGNKKESVFRITPSGEGLFRLHEQMHQQSEQKLIDFFKQYSNQDLRLLLRFLNDYASL